MVFMKGKRRWVSQDQFPVSLMISTASTEAEAINMASTASKVPPKLDALPTPSRRSRPLGTKLQAG